AYLEEEKRGQEHEERQRLQVAERAHKQLAESARKQKAARKKWKTSTQEGGRWLAWDDEDRRRRFSVIAGATWVITAVAAVAYFSQSGPAGPQTLPIAGKVTATQLWEEYHKNPKEANKKYGGNIIEISGTISKVMTDKKIPRIEFET